MSTGDLINIHPSELKFPFELKKQISCSMQLSNKTDQYVAFKLKTNNLKKYCVRPSTGVVSPGSSCSVTVTMQAQKEAPADMKCKDKFLVQSVISTTKHLAAETFNKEEGKVVKEFKLRVIYIPANPPSQVPEESEEGFPPRPTLQKNGYQTLSSIARRLDDFKGNSSEVYLQRKFLAAKMSTSDLINIHPSELKFPFELKKQSSCSMQLSNKTDQYVAFKLKTNNPKNYCVRPCKGVVSPGSSCSVTVTMQAQKKAPVDMKCKDKFLVQSVITTTKDLAAETFNKEEGKMVTEFKLRVIYNSTEEGSPARPTRQKNGYQALFSVCTFLVNLLQLDRRRLKKD